MTRILIILLAVALLVVGAIALTQSFFLLSARSALDTPNPLAIAIAESGKALLVPGDTQAKANPAPAGIETVRAAQPVFTSRCVICHGRDGKGNTTIGAHIYPRAADLTAARTQGKSDGTLFWIIQNGLPHTGMPGWKDTLTDDQIWQLVQLIRQLPQGLPAPPTPTPAPTTANTNTVTVDIIKAVYEPDAITVPVGTRVVWLNHDDDDHTITSAKDAPQVLDSPTLKQNQTYEFTFTQKGTFHYGCKVHDYMEGMVFVQ